MEWVLSWKVLIWLVGRVGSGFGEGLAILPRSGASGLYGPRGQVRIVRVGVVAVGYIGCRIDGHSVLLGLGGVVGDVLFV